jgi:sugar transferase (PEP-CTERM/EpsH1 system associated)
MRILFLSSRLPYPPHRGDRLRLFNIMRTLSSSNHRLFLISFIEQRSDHQYVEKLRPYCEKIVSECLPRYQSLVNAARGVFSNNPLQVAYYGSERMRRTVASFIDRSTIDLIYVHLFRMAPYAENGKGIYKVLDFTDIVSEHLRSSIRFRSWGDKRIHSLEWARIRNYEIKMSQKFDECWVISHKEAELLSRLSPEANVQIVPNGVDFHSFKPMPGDKSDQLIFVGHLSSAYNVDAVLFFCREILPRVKKSIPWVKFCIVGRSPHGKIRRLADQRTTIVTGFVEDLCGLLNKSKVFVAPFRFASGIQNKILEAMASGLPVVATSIANEGLRATPNEEILIADDPEMFSNLLIELLTDGNRREKIGARAREFVEKNFNWNASANRIREIERVVSSTSRQPRHDRWTSRRA